LKLTDIFRSGLKLPAAPLRLRDNGSYSDCTQTIDVLLRHHAPSVLFDIGAHNGDWSRIVIESLGYDIYIAMFEPQKKHFKNLESIFAGQKNKFLYNVALGTIAGQGVIKGGGASASLLHASDLQNSTFPGSFNEQDTEDVQVHSLDEMIESNKLQYPDVIKIDVQGFELDVFKGALKTLTQAKYLIVELSFVSLYKGQPRNTELMEFLEVNNFRLVDFGYQWRNKEKEIIQTDALFKRS
jgi:FkbM family methyltransferase